MNHIIINIEELTTPTTSTMAATTTILFTSDAVDCIRRMAAVLREHDLCKRFLKYYEPMDAPEFNHNSEKRIASLIYSISSRRYYYIAQYIATSVDVILAVNFLLTQIFQDCFLAINENHVNVMLDAYPTVLLGQVCQVSFCQALILGRSMKAFINFRSLTSSWLPKAFQNLLGGTIPLVGHKQSPLTNAELEALLRYLETRKRIYVELLLGCLFELGQYEKTMTPSSLTEDGIIQTCNSSWFYLLSFGSSLIYSDTYFALAQDTTNTTVDLTTTQDFNNTTVIDLTASQNLDDYDTEPGMLQELYIELAGVTVEDK